MGVEQFVRFVVHVAAGAVAGVGIAAVLFGGAFGLARAFRRFRRRRPLGFRHALAALAVALATFYAGSKHVHCTWDEAFRDCRADVDTNDWRTVTFEWKVAPGVPPSAKAEFYYSDAEAFKDEAATNAPLTLAGSTNMAALSWSYVAESPSATSNMAWYVKCSYSQGPTVVTNGVYHVSCAETNGLALKWVPVGVRVYDGRTVSWRRISPPEGMAEPKKPEKSASETAETGDGGTPTGGAND